MSDEDKRAEYDRSSGKKTRYVHEEAYVRGVLSSAAKRIRRNQRYIFRYGDTPKGNEKPAYKAIKVTNAQHQAYQLISGQCKNEGTVRWETCRTVGIRAATLKALISKQLITKDDSGLISLFVNTPTQEEMMAKHGVGKIVIKMGVG